MTSTLDLIEIALARISGETQTKRWETDESLQGDDCDY